MSKIQKAKQERNSAIKGQKDMRKTNRELVKEIERLREIIKAKGLS